MMRPVGLSSCNIVNSKECKRIGPLSKQLAQGRQQGKAAEGRERRSLVYYIQRQR